MTQAWGLEQLQIPSRYPTIRGATVTELDQVLKDHPTLTEEMVVAMVPVVVMAEIHR